MEQSPLRFKEWLGLTEEIRDRIRILLDGQNLILFFKKDGDIYGAPEESRIVFSKLKQPDDETTKDWVKEAHFIAINLSKAVHGERTQNMFDQKDLKKIHVIDKEEAEEALVKKAKNGGNPLQQLLAFAKSRPLDTTPDEAPNMIRLKDKK